MMRQLFLAIALLLSACIPSEPISESEYYEEYVRVIEEWNADLTLPAADCGEPHIAVLSDSEFREHSALCPYPNCDGNCYFCAAAYTISEPRHHVIVLSPYLSDVDAHEGVRHESIHVTSFCTKHSRTWDDTLGYLWVGGDSAHKDPRLWGNGGVLDRARLPSE